MPRPLILVRLFDRLYGLLATPVLAALLFGVVSPAVILAPTLGLRRKLGRHGVRLALLCVGIPIRVRGRQHLPAAPCIAVANHASYVDGVVLTAALPAHFTFVVQDGAADWPLVGLVLRRMGVTFVNRSSAREGAAQTRALIRRVQDGESLGIFAEGTFEAESGLLPFKKGAFLIATRAAVPVLPVGIRGTRRFYGGHRRLPRWSPVEIELCAPIPASEDANQLRAATRNAVLRVCGEHDAHAPDTPDTLEAAA